MGLYLDLFEKKRAMKRKRIYELNSDILVTGSDMETVSGSHRGIIFLTRKR